MRELPDDQRTLIVLGFFNDLTHVELARRTGIPLGTVPARPNDPAQLKQRVLRAAQAARALVSAAAEFIDYAPGIRRAVTPGAGVTLVRWIFEAPLCGDVPPEVHAFSQSGVVLEGSFSLCYGDGSQQRCNRSDAYTIPAGTVHGAHFHERTALFDVYSPNHAEFEALYRRQTERRATTQD